MPIISNNNIDLIDKLFDKLPSIYSANIYNKVENLSPMSPVTPAEHNYALKTGYNLSLKRFVSV